MLQMCHCHRNRLNVQLKLHVRVLHAKVSVPQRLIIEDKSNTDANRSPNQILEERKKIFAMTVPTRLALNGYISRIEVKENHQQGQLTSPILHPRLKFRLQGCVEVLWCTAALTRKILSTSICGKSA